MIPRMVNKLREDRNLTYRICAIAFDKKNDFLGMQMNGHRESLSNRRGAGLHAEAELMKRYGKLIDKIYILRVGNSYDALPIHPCENCAKIAAKLGIKIIPLHEEIENLTDLIK
jgi:hypothetical protein